MAVWRNDTPDRLGAYHNRRARRGGADSGNAANRIEDRAERQKAIAAIRAAAPASPRRVFVGTNAERAATVTLADANGKPRLTLTVDPAGNPRIEFLDDNGTVTTRLPGG